MTRNNYIDSTKALQKFFAMLITKEKKHYIKHQLAILHLCEQQKILVTADDEN